MSFYYISVLSSLLTSGYLLAHEDPAAVASSLTHQIEHFHLDNKAKNLGGNKRVNLANLYFKRAIEFKVLGKRQEAHSDLEKYTQLMPSECVGWLELARIEVVPDKRIQHAKQAIKVASTKLDKSQSLIIQAEAHYELSEYQKALMICEQTLNLTDEDGLSVISFKSHLLWRLDELEKRVDFLAEASKENPSVVLQHEWIDAKLDAGQAGDVKQQIHREMSESRFKSSWLIRAARCEKEGSDKAKKFAQTAVDEILDRLHPERPDVTLQMDLVRAYALFNEQVADQQAQKYLKIASAQQHDRWEITELSEMLKLRGN